MPLARPKIAARSLSESEFSSRARRVASARQAKSGRTFALPAWVAINREPIGDNEQQTANAMLLEIWELDDAKHGFVHEVLRVRELAIPLMECGDRTLANWEQHRPARRQEFRRQAGTRRAGGATASLDPPSCLLSHLLPERGHALHDR